mmetsp:Transcript_61221/g.189683  ORF Transcript_61221/g.189683 Transcript_61221/m.189683 type:complete len:229 (-) Transcript_61221:17-703(-)
MAEKACKSTTPLRRSLSATECQWATDSHGLLQLSGSSTEGKRQIPNPSIIKTVPSHASYAFAADKLHERLNGRVGAHVQGCDNQAELAERVGHLRRDERVAADVEEAVLHVKKLVVQVQCLGPHLAHGFAKTAVRRPLPPGWRLATGGPGGRRGPAEALFSRAGLRLQGRHPRACQDGLLRPGGVPAGSVRRTAVGDRGSHRHRGVRPAVAGPLRRSGTVRRPGPETA